MHPEPHHYHLLPRARQLHVGWYLLPLTLMIISGTATMAVLLETGNSVILLFPIRLRKSHSHAHCLAGEWTAQTLLWLLWSLLKCSSSAAHSVNSPTLQRLLRRWLPSPTKQNSCSPSFISLHSICHFLTCYPCFISCYIFPQKLTQSQEQVYCHGAWTLWVT